MKTASHYTITTILSTAVFLVDNDIGRSVTNDAENVVSAINSEHPGKRIFYKDTTGNWDELVHNNGLFLRFAGIAPATKTKFAQHFN